MCTVLGLLNSGTLSSHTLYLSFIMFACVESLYSHAPISTGIIVIITWTYSCAIVFHVSCIVLLYYLL